MNQASESAGSEREGVMDVHSDGLEEEEVTDEGIGESEMEELVPK